MNDTNLKAERLFHNLLMTKSGAERLTMGCSMFDDAKAIVLAGLRAERPAMDERECRIQILLRLYGQELGESRSQRISAHFRQA